MLKKIISAQNSWWTIILTISTVLDSCKGCDQKKDTRIPPPASLASIPSTSTDEAKSGDLNSSVDSFSAESSDSSQASSSSGISSVSSSSGLSSGSSSSSVSSSSPSSSSPSSGVSSGSDSSTPVTPVSPSDNLQPFTGLPNLGNTCYMNATLQIIAALYQDDVESNFGLKDLINKINSTRKALDAEDIKAFIASLPEEAKRMAQSHVQQDPDEFIESIKDYFLKKHDILYTEDRFFKIQDESEENIYKCNSDSHSSHLLSIAIRENTFDLNNMIKFYQQQLVQGESGIDISSGNMSPCSKKDLPSFVANNQNSINPIAKNADKAPEKDYIKQRVFTHLPSKLYLKLVRNSDSKKDNTSITGALSITIDLDPNQGSATSYDLQGFIAHLGSGTQYGHYVAYVKREGTWYKANDQDVNEVDESVVRTASEQAYLLFYKQK